MTNTDFFDATNNGQPIRVLLIDDDEDQYVLTRHRLSKIASHKMVLDWAPSYERGLELIRSNSHDVYLLDYRLGAQTGIDLLQEALAAGCEAPIIILTAENPEVDAQAMRLGAADFLSKDKLDSSLLERSIRYSIKHYQTLKTLREREATISAFMSNVPCAVYMKDLEGRYTYANETCAAVFRRSIAEVIGKKDSDLLPKGVANKSRAIDEQVVTQNRAIETTESYTRDDGPHYWLTNRFPICGADNRPMMVGGAAIDITENKRLEREIQETSEREKRRIGQDLHDGLGQYLTGIACMVKVVEQKLASKDLPEAADVKKITTMVNETIAQARDLARGLCPVELENNGLHAALEELANRVSRTNINCSFRSPQTIQVYDNATAVHVYRIAQEAVNNAIKHGRAQNITVGLATQNNQVLLTVQDDGQGFPKASPKNGGMGLRVMNYRAGMIGATISIEPAVERGTLLRCLVPNKPPVSAAKRERGGKTAGSSRRGSPAPEEVEA